jgi:hypothetical protein
MTRKNSPKADGFGKYVRGGEDGEVLFINSLTDSASRNAWTKSNSRIIIPRVAGYVELTSRLSVSYGGRDNLTYLGVLAPLGSDLVYKNWEVRISSVKNILIRGLKSRPGDRNKEVSNVSGDAFTCAKISTEPEGCTDVYIDHSVGSWSTDEVMSFDNVKRGTIQYCMFYEPLHFATINEKGTPHGFGHIWGGENVSFHHNLHAYMQERVPQFQNNSEDPLHLCDVRNNAYYAWNNRPSDLGNQIKKINFIKNSYWRKINYSGGGASGVAGLGCTCQFRGDTIENSSRAYLFGNKLKKFEGGSWVNVHSSLEDDPVSQRVLLYGTNSTNTSNLRSIVGVTTPFAIPDDTYEFNETVEESDARINALAGTIHRDPVDLRILDDWNNGLVPITGSKTGIVGLIDAPEDSKHFNSSNTGYPTLSAGTQILDGPAPHYLPSWFTTKYNLSTGYDYTLAGNPTTRPERFIIFKDGIGTQLSQYNGTVDYESDLIYNVYYVLSFHYVPIYPSGYEIDLLEETQSVTPTPTPNQINEELRLTNILRFDNNYTLGTTTEPIEDDLLINYDGFESGEVLNTPKIITIYHHSPTVPSFISNFNITSGSYSTTYRTLNTITITFFSLSNKTITITNTPNSTQIHSIIPRRNLTWEGLRRNANIGFAVDTSPNPVHGRGNPYKHYSIVDNEGNIGFGVLSTSNSSCFIVPKTGKISLQSPFAFSFWSKAAGDEHPFPHYSKLSANAIRFLGFGYNTDGGNGGNSFQIQTESWSDKRIKARFLLGTSSSSNREIIGPSGDVNFQLTNEYKHIFVWYDGTTLGMTINNQYTITKTNSNLLNFNTTHNSDFYIGGNRNSHLNESSWRTNKHYMRDLRWYNGYIPTEPERTQLFIHGLQQL